MILAALRARWSFFSDPVTCKGVGGEEGVEGEEGEEGDEGEEGEGEEGEEEEGEEGEEGEEEEGEEGEEDGAWEVKSIEQVAEEELNVQQNHGQAVELVSNPEVWECDIEEWSQ